MSKKKIKEEFVIPPDPTEAYIMESTTDQVGLYLLDVPWDERHTYGPKYQEFSAKPEMLDELVLAIRHKRSEAEGNESLSITARGIVWKRYRDK